jgi:hypothetical protein
VRHQSNNHASREKALAQNPATSPELRRRVEARSSCSSFLLEQSLFRIMTRRIVYGVGLILTVACKLRVRIVAGFEN